MSTSLADNSKVRDFTLVDRSKLRDPRQLLYHYPSLSAVKYMYISERFYRNFTLKTAEDICKMFGYLVVPATCLRSTSKDASRRLLIHGYAYYVKQPTELTRPELRRYLECVQEGSDDGAKQDDRDDTEHHTGT